MESCVIAQNTLSVSLIDTTNTFHVINIPGRMLAIASIVPRFKMIMSG